MLLDIATASLPVITAFGVIFADKLGDLHDAVKRPTAPKHTPPVVDQPDNRPTPAPSPSPDERPDSKAKASVCRDDQSGSSKNQDYHYSDTRTYGTDRPGAAVHAHATLRAPLPDGTRADPLTPPGWREPQEQPKLDRGHLVGKQLGGDGTTLKNLVTEYSNFNQGWRVTPGQIDMRPVEQLVVGAVNVLCLEVDLNVTPIYAAGEPDPETLWPDRLPVDKIHYVATTNAGFVIDLVLNNRS
ncbi:MAG: DNA/RNA non-specific endonuclease [Acidimicrobiales bacterium]